MPDPITSPSSVPVAPPNWVERGMLLGWALLLFAVFFSSGLRHHRFPFYYHPDEPGKAEQVIKGEYNFNHPMLLLATARLAVEAFHVPKEPQAVVEMGRRVSAAFMAGAVVALSLLAYLWRGWRPAVIAGAALTLHHQLFELAHYMKEDSALLFGVACTLLAGMAYSQRSTPWRAAVLGGSCALALSGKYIGILMLAIALPVLWARLRNLGASPRTATAHALAFVGALIAVFVAVNFTLILHLVTFRTSLQNEVNLVVTGQGDATRSVPHFLYWNVFIDNTTPAIWILLVALVSVCLPRLSRLSLFQKLLVLFPFAYTILLSFSPKENDRYFLPATAVFTLLAAIGTEAMPLLLHSAARALSGHSASKFLRPRARQWIIGASAAALLLLQLVGWAPSKPGWSQYDAAFVRDDIAALVTWMKTELSPEAIVVADARAGLPSPSRKKNARRGKIVPQTLVVSRLSSDWKVLEQLQKLGLNHEPVRKDAEATLEQLRAAGVTHVIVSENSYGRFFRRDLRPKDTADRKFQEAKAFYEELLRHHVPIFERERGTVIYLHPGIRVYPIQKDA